MTELHAAPGRRSPTISVATGSVLGGRSANQDRVHADSTLLALFDGVGGRDGGDLAASTALGTVLREVADDAAKDALDLPRVLLAANAAIQDLNSKTGLTCATTGIAVAIRVDPHGQIEAQVSWVGDSAVFLVRDRHVNRLTEPHAHGGVLSRWLGGHDANHSPSTHRRVVFPGDKLALVSDGVTDVLSDAQIGGILQRSNAPADSTLGLIEAALQMRTMDNASAVVAHINGEFVPAFGTSGVVPPLPFVMDDLTSHALPQTAPRTGDRTVS